MKPFLKTTACAALFALTAVPCSAFSFKTRSADVSQAGEEWMEGYLKIEQAVSAEKEDNDVLALKFFNEARQILLSVQKEYPDWNKELISYRLEFCNGNISRLEAKVKSGKMNASELFTEVQRLKAELDDKSVPPEIQTKLNELQVLRSHQKTLEDQISQMQKSWLEAQKIKSANIEYKENLKKLNDEKENYADNLKDLENRLQEVTSQLTNLKNKRENRSEEIRNLERRLKEAQRITKNREREIKRMREQVSDLRSEASEQRKKAMQLSQAEEQYTQELKKLRKEAKDAKRVTELESRLRETSKKLKEHNRKLAEADKKIASLSDDRERLAKVTADSQKKTQQIQSKITTLSSELKKKEETLSENEKLIASLKDNQQQLKSQLTTAESLVEKQKERLASLQTNLKDKQEAVEKMENLMEKSKVNSIGKLEKQLNDFQTRLQKADREKTMLKKELSKLSEAEKARRAEEQALLEQERRLKEKEHEREVAYHEFLKQATEFEKAANMEKAAYHYRKALEVKPGSAQVIARLGIFHADRGEDAKAEDYLTRAFNEDPEDISILLPLGLSQLRQEKAIPAFATFARAVALAPKNADYRRFLAAACSSLGWNDAAEESLKRSFELNNKNSETAYNLALFYATLDTPKINKARDWYNTARKLGAPKDPGMEEFLNQ